MNKNKPFERQSIDFIFWKPESEISCSSGSQKEQERDKKLRHKFKFRGKEQNCKVLLFEELLFDFGFKYTGCLFFKMINRIADINKISKRIIIQVLLSSEFLDAIGLRPYRPTCVSAPTFSSIILSP